jgi:hypothetical protein
MTQAFVTFRDNVAPTDNPVLLDGEVLCLIVFYHRPDKREGGLGQKPLGRSEEPALSGYRIHGFAVRLGKRNGSVLNGHGLITLFP